MTRRYGASFFGHSHEHLGMGVDYSGDGDMGCFAANTRQVGLGDITAANKSYFYGVGHGFAFRDGVG